MTSSEHDRVPLLKPNVDENCLFNTLVCQGNREKQKTVRKIQRHFLHLTYQKLRVVMENFKVWNGYSTVLQKWTLIVKHASFSKGHLHTSSTWLICSVDYQKQSRYIRKKPEIIIEAVMLIRVGVGFEQFYCWQWWGICSYKYKYHSNVLYHSDILVLLRSKEMVTLELIKMCMPKQFHKFP